MALNGQAEKSDKSASEHKKSTKPDGKRGEKEPESSFKEVDLFNLLTDKNFF